MFLMDFFLFFVLLTVRLVYFRSLCGLYQVDGCVDANHLKLDLCRYYVRVYEMNLNQYWSFHHSIEYLGSSVARPCFKSDFI
jgi:hypothetical protein